MPDLGSVNLGQFFFNTKIRFASLAAKMVINVLNILVSMLNDVHHLINVLYYYAQASLPY